MTVLAVDTAVVPEESNRSAVSWAAIAAGAVASAGFSLFLFELLAGLGLSVVSPWANSGASATTIKIGGGVAVILISVMASALGGYLAGRMRTKWVGIHTDETFFRDTAHGLLAWAFATVISAALLAGAVTHMVGGTLQGVSSNPGAAPDRNAYYVDSLFRSDRPAPPGDASAASNQEAGRILTRAILPGNTLSVPDRAYLARLVAARTGLSQDDAEKRVNEVILDAQKAADAARKTAAHFALLMAAALLAGALASALAATIGGRERDA